MSESVYFKYKGTEFTSLESMPSDVRAEYEKRLKVKQQLHRGLEQAQHGLEQSQHGLDQIANSQPGEQVAPAWGGPRGSGGVPIPQAFDLVAGLGPAAAVFEHNSGMIIAFPNFKAPTPDTVVLYRDGFAFQKGKDLLTWRWDEITIIQSDLSREGSHGSTVHQYTLTQRNGDKLILDDRIKNVGGAAEVIKRQVSAKLLPSLAQAYSTGQSITFGPVTIHKQNGFQLDRKLYAWDAIQNIQVENGRLKLTLRDGKKHEVRTSVVPNIELLAQLIGLKFYEPALEYYSFG